MRVHERLNESVTEDGSLLNIWAVPHDCAGYRMTSRAVFGHVILIHETHELL